MAFADELRENTVTEEQRKAQRRSDVLAGREDYVDSFRYACGEAARSGKRSCTLVFQSNYDDHIRNFYTEDKATVQEVRDWVERALAQDGFKRLKVSVESIHSDRAVERTVLKSLLGRTRHEKVTYYTLRVEASW